MSENNNWMPIESAPRDGAYFLACGRDDGEPDGDLHFAAAFWHEGLQQFREGSPHDEHSALLYLTYWQPLPPPPTTETP